MFFPLLLVDQTFFFFNCCFSLLLIEDSKFSFVLHRYHVTNFFAPSSRCGTPEDLKSLIDKAHELDLLVLMDMVHR